MTTTALDALLAPQRVLCGADCGSKKRVLETIAGLIAGLFNQAGLREQLRACRDDESLRATMPSAWSQGGEA